MRQESHRECIRRRDDGSLDTDYYLVLGHKERGRQAGQLFALLKRHAGRLFAASAEDQNGLKVCHFGRQ